MHVRCPTCQETLAVNPQPQPTRVKCPFCETLLQIPAVPASSPQTPAAQTPAAQTPAPQTPAAPSSPAGGGAGGGDPFGSLPGLPSTQTPGTGGFPSAPMQTRPTAAGEPARSSGAKGKQQKTKRKGGFPIWGYLAIGAASLVVLPILCCGLLGFIGAYFQSTDAVISQGLSAVPAPESFPDLGPPIQTFPSGVTMRRVQIRNQPAGPGQNMDLRVYMPAGQHAPQSVPCVLVAPAGTPLLHGATVDGGDYHDETLPYAEAGMVCVHYSIDGAIPDSVDQNDDEAYSRVMPKAFKYFKASGGGIVNGRNALEYAVKQIEMVDPKRICAAGHSSAGTLALILAAAEPRITHCAAYAPAYDTEKRMAEAINDPMTRALLRGIKSFFEWYSPTNHVDDYRCKMLVFHARDDSNVPFADATAFTSKMKAAGKDVEFVQADSGGHYAPMVSQGIPAAIRWLGQ